MRIETNLSSGTPQDPSRLRRVPGEVIDFCFQRLNHNYPLPIQHGAGKCLGVLSEYFLEEVSALFIKKSAHLRTDDDERDFSTYQRAAKDIQFGITPQKRETTIHYLQSLHSVAPSVASCASPAPVYRYRAHALTTAYMSGENIWVHRNIYSHTLSLYLTIPIFSTLQLKTTSSCR